MNRPVVVSLSTSDWAFPYWTSRQFLMYELAQNCPVQYVTDRIAVGACLKAVFSGIERAGPFARPKNLRVFSRRWPRVYRYRRFDALIESMFAHAIERQARKLGKGARVCYVWEPSLLGVVKRLKFDIVVYHPFDMFRHFPESEQYLIESERELCAIADMLITPHRKVAEALGHPNSHVINNGVFLPAFPERRTIEPIIIVDRQSPVIGYVGAINDKVDFSLLAELFGENPRWQLLMVGFEGPGSWKTSQEFLSLAALPNVTIRPGVPIDQVARVMAGFDVGIVPYRLSGWARFSESPLKLYQYWAMGVPVVSTSLPNLQPDPGYLEVAHSVAGWRCAIESQLNFGDSASQARIRRKAEGHSWTSKAERILELIEQTARH